VKLVGIMFYIVHLVENNFVKTTFGVKFPGGMKFLGEGNSNFSPGNGLE